MKTLILATTPLLDKAESLRTYYSEVVMKTIINSVPVEGNPTVVYASEISEQELKRLLHNTTHIIIPGGDDIHPSFYGGNQKYEGQGSHNQHADTIQITATRYAIKENLNYLGICRGLQILNVSTGGTLHQHIPAHQKKLDHSNYENRFTEHTIVVPHPHPALTTDHPVHCAHHQTIDKLGEELNVIAYAGNEHIEAVAHNSTASKILGVQYHPEATLSKDTHLSLINKWLYS